MIQSENSIIFMSNSQFFLVYSLNNTKQQTKQDQFNKCTSFDFLIL